MQSKKAVHAGSPLQVVASLQQLDAMHDAQSLVPQGNPHAVVPALSWIPTTWRHERNAPIETVTVAIPATMPLPMRFQRAPRGVMRSPRRQ
jgi:hypothetical protein